MNYKIEQDFRGSDWYFEKKKYDMKIYRSVKEFLKDNGGLRK